MNKGYIFIGSEDPCDLVVIFTETLEEMNKKLVEMQITGDDNFVSLYEVTDTGEQVSTVMNGLYFIPQYA